MVPESDRQMSKHTWQRHEDCRFRGKTAHGNHVAHVTLLCIGLLTIRGLEGDSCYCEGCDGDKQRRQGIQSQFVCASGR